MKKYTYFISIRYVCDGEKPVIQSYLWGLIAFRSTKIITITGNYTSEVATYNNPLTYDEIDNIKKEAREFIFTEDMKPIGVLNPEIYLEVLCVSLLGAQETDENHPQNSVILKRFSTYHMN